MGARGQEWAMGNKRGGRKGQGCGEGQDERSDTGIGGFLWDGKGIKIQVGCTEPLMRVSQRTSLSG